MAFGKCAIRPLVGLLLVIGLTSAAFMFPVTAVADVGRKADPKDTANMSLGEARDIIQRGHRFWGSDGAGDHSENVMEFYPEQMVSTNYNADGTQTRFLGCPYETFVPYVDSQVTTFQDGIHKGLPLYEATGGSCNIPATYTVEIRLPTADAAYRVAVALLRWKMSTLAERQALPALEEKQFATVAETYKTSNPRPETGEDVRRFQIAAEVAVREKRFSDAVNAYQDGLKIAPWWPEGQFNAALLLGALRYYGEAIGHMKNYLALVPQAGNARQAQDKIYQWQAEVPTFN